MHNNQFMNPWLHQEEHMVRQDEEEESIRAYETVPEKKDVDH